MLFSIQICEERGTRGSWELRKGRGRWGNEEDWGKGWGKSQQSEAKIYKTPDMKVVSNSKKEFSNKTDIKWRRSIHLRRYISPPSYFVRFPRKRNPKFIVMDCIGGNFLKHLPSFYINLLTRRAEHYQYQSKETNLLACKAFSFVHLRVYSVFVFIFFFPILITFIAIYSFFSCTTW